MLKKIKFHVKKTGLRKVFLAICSLFLLTQLSAQEGGDPQVIYNGKVIDKDGNPVIGATVTIPSTNQSTTTGGDGTFSILTDAFGKEVLVSYAGSNSQSLVINSANSVIVTLDDDDKLSEVVVTAFGITRDKKSLGYAVSDVGEEAIAQRPSADISRTLNGQAAGVDIVGASGMTGAGTNINIRGFSSITGNTQPLWVVDGVPINTSTNTDINSFIDNITPSSRFLDLDPASIEKISVLKGLSATVVYGEEGRNGVILVTTKNGANSSTLNKATGLNITVTETLILTRPSGIPETQKNWGGGFNNGVGYLFFSNWGGRTNGQPLVHPYARDLRQYANLRQQFLDPEGVNGTGPPIRNDDGDIIARSIPYPYINYNSVERFFDRTGLSNRISINISGGTNKSKVNASFSYLNDNGFIKTNTLEKINLGLGVVTDLGSGFVLKSSINAVRTNYKTPPITVSQGSRATFEPSLFGDIMYTPLTIDLNGLPFQDPVTGGAVYYRTGNDIQNPLWTLNNVSYQENISRVFGNTGLYKTFKDFSINYRLGYDITRGDYINSANKGGAVTTNNRNLPLGYLNIENRNDQIWDHLFNVNYNKFFGSFSINAIAGINFRYFKTEINSSTSTGQQVFGLLRQDNFTDYTASNSTFTSYSNGIFAEGTLGYEEGLFLTIGARNTTTSVLEPANANIFYPSVSVSFIPTTLVPFLRNNEHINYLKLRLGYGTSANLPGRYLVRQATSIDSRAFVDNQGDVVATGSVSNRLANPNLKPELLSEIEFGLESRLFNFINFEITLFRKQGDNQILDRTLDPATGYTTQTINAGRVINQGIESALGITLFKNKDWNISTNFLFYLYRNEVQGIPDDIDRILVNGFTNLGNYATNGAPINAIWGDYIVTDPNGNRVINAGTGAYRVSTDQRQIGDPNPDAKLNGILSVSYKFITLGTRLEYTFGGDIYSVTARSMIARGLAKETDFDRFNSVILDGVNLKPGAESDKPESYTPNRTQTDATSAYFLNNFGADEISVYDATLFRIREISLTVSAPKTVIEKLAIVKGLNFTFVVNNPYFKAFGFPDGYNVDPENTGIGAGQNGRGFEFLSGPTATQYSFSLQVRF